MLQVQSPFPQLFETAGTPLEGGSVYVGATGLNPETNPISVYWDDAGTQPAAQPLKTSGGYIVRNGTPARVYTSLESYSLTVRNKKGSLVYSVMDATAMSNLQTNLAASTGTSLVGFSHANTYAAGTTGLALQAFINVKNAPYNAKGDGVTDDTAAIQAAITAAHIGGQASGNKAVYLPAGIYLLSASLALPDYCTLIGAGRFSTILIGSMAGKSFIRSQYGETPGIGQRPTGLDVRGFSIQPSSIAAGSVAVNFRNTQYSNLIDVFTTNTDSGVVTDQITQYCNFENVIVQVANNGGVFASVGGGNRIVACDFGGNVVPLDFNGGAWDVLGVTAEALLTTTTYCVRAGRPGGQSTLVHATSLYVEGTSASIITLQIENSVTQSAFRMHRHSTLGTIVNNAGDNVFIENPGQGYFNPVYRAQRIAFAGTVDGVERASIVSEGGNTVAFKDAARTGDAHAYMKSLIVTGAAFGQAGAVNIGNVTAATVGAAGGASALPATPVGYIQVFVGNTEYKVPYYTK